jgi:hypothetical protein
MYKRIFVNNFIAFILERLSLINNNRYTYSMNGIINRQLNKIHCVVLIISISTHLFIHLTTQKKKNRKYTK